MIEVTGIAQKQAWADHIFPPVEALTPGCWSIPVPIPESPLRYVLVYVLEIPDGIVLVDAGWNTDDAWNALNAGLAETGHAITDVRGVLITHIHPDHFGLAGRVREASGAWVAMHPAEAQTLPERYGGMAPLLAKMQTWHELCGVPDDETAILSSSSLPLRPMVHYIEPDRLFNDGDRVPLPGWDVRAIWTPGHTPGHLCFYDADRKLLLSGDHILPRITPNIAAHPQQPPNPLGLFLDSLLKVGALDVDEVYPAHEYRFRGLSERVNELTEHHEKRLAEIVATLSGSSAGMTCFEITAKLTWSRSWDQVTGWIRRAAVGETAAHVILLQFRGQVQHDGGVPQRWRLTG
jgi:glyoxylase-like metal-dependent hydrolase (beta-lactamase superfamily II)